MLPLLSSLYEFIPLFVRCVCVYDLKSKRMPFRVVCVCVCACYKIMPHPFLTILSRSFSSHFFFVFYLCTYNVLCSWCVCARIQTNCTSIWYTEEPSDAANGNHLGFEIYKNSGFDNDDNVNNAFYRAGNMKTSDYADEKHFDNRIHRWVHFQWILTVSVYMYCYIIAIVQVEYMYIS